MLKTKSKILLVVLALVMIISTVCFATEGTTPGENARTTPGENARTSEDEVAPISEGTEVPTSEDTETQPITEPEIHNGDLYLFGDNVVMDKLVDGNVFIFGKNVEITGKVNGSLFVCGNKVTFGEDSYIVQSIYLAANEVSFNCASTDLYAVANKIDMSYNSFIIRDLRVAASEFDFKGGVGRDAFVTSGNFTFGTEDGNSAIVYGNLEYSSPNELELSKELVQGEIKYSKTTETDNSVSVAEIILEKVMNLIDMLVLNFVVFLLAIWLAPKFVEQSASFIGKKSLISFGIGLAVFFATIIASIILLFSYIAVPLAFILLGILAIMMFIASAVTSICITYKIKEQIKLDKKYMKYVILAAVTLAIWILQLIPYVGGLVSIVVTLVGFGVMITYIYEIIKKRKVEVK